VSYVAGNMSSQIVAITVDYSLYGTGVLVSP